VEYGGQPILICSRQYEDEDHRQATPQISIEIQRRVTFGSDQKDAESSEPSKRSVVRLSILRVIIGVIRARPVRLYAANSRKSAALLRSCLTTGDLDGDPQPLKRKALIDTPPYRYWRCSRLLGLQFVTVLTSAVYISSLFGEKPLCPKPRGQGLSSSFWPDSSASSPMKYLDDFVDSLGVVDHSMAAGDDAF
jgi:hypothetical protein